MYTGLKRFNLAEFEDEHACDAPDLAKESPSKILDIAPLTSACLRRDDCKLLRKACILTYSRTPSYELQFCVEAAPLDDLQIT